MYCRKMSSLRTVTISSLQLNDLFTEHSYFGQSGLQFEHFQIYRMWSVEEGFYYVLLKSFKN